MEAYANVPMKWVGPIKITGETVNEEIKVPLATFESPLWPSTNRGARVSVMSGGINATLISDKMARSVVVEAKSAQDAHQVCQQIKLRENEIAQVPEQHSRFTKLLSIHPQIVANLIYIRFEFSTGDASGQNMSTLASDKILSWLLNEFPSLRYVSISGNYCTDKKVSAVNGILGRGKYVVAEMTIPRKICKRYLKATPEDIVDINIKKNLVGSIIAGSLRSANADYANRLLGFYLATGQDAANIIEGSQGITYAEVRNEDLYFSVTLPNLILGSMGNGKDLTFATENLKALGCLEKRAPGENAKRLAVIAASSVLCGELSLLAAQTNQGELMDCHLRMERTEKKGDHHV
jgi:hydroxymethylglutaryl-CoA reductase (NADPH)